MISTLVHRHPHLHMAKLTLQFDCYWPYDTSPATLQEDLITLLQKPTLQEIFIRESVQKSSVH